MAQSSQKFIARNRAPRVQIEYDVELYGAEKKIQLPFVMGVLADLPVSRRSLCRRSRIASFSTSTSTTSTSRMKAIKPRAAFQVPNTLTGEGNISVDITFESMDDFSPAAVARKVDALNKLLAGATAAFQSGHLHGRQNRRRGVDSESCCRTRRCFKRSLPSKKPADESGAS